ncbi:MAG: hypothetical protein JXA90_00260 [Planctomycetes bacterium]|nr:hypothetical protein [Planctomycetota bacterium]
MDERGLVLFGLTLTKMMVIVSLAVLLFAVPLMSFIIVLVERHRDRSRRRGDHRCGR